MNSNKHLSKRIVVASVVAASLIGSLSAAQTDYAAETVVEAESGVTAGIITTLTTVQADAFANATSIATETETEVTVVAESESAVDSEWANRLMANVDDYLSIRAEGSEDAEIVGKLYKGDVAEVVAEGEGWTQISSGSVTGYVSNDYCVFANDAKELASQVCETKATSLTAGLRVRESASEDGKILTVMPEGDTAVVNTEAEAVDGWVAVSYDDCEGYVKADYVEVAVEYGEAISIEEEQAIIAAQKKAEEEAAAAAAAAQTTATTTTQGSAVAASYDDVTLLAALIQCEAGNECYEGQLAVGAVVVNRLHGGAYGGSIYSVIYAPSQFGPAGTGQVAAVAAAGPSGSCIQAAQEALNGVSNIGGCTCFHRNDGRAGIVIGNHVFY